MVVNKIDLANERTFGGPMTACQKMAGFNVSAKTGEGIEEIKDFI